MPSQRIPYAPFGSVTSRRHAKLLLHLAESGGGGASVKDLRLRRVVPPSSAHLDSSPDFAAAKPGSVESTPPAPEVAVAQDRERKPIPPRSKLVRDPGSFGYRRLLPFLNEMAKNDCSNVVDTSSLDGGSVDGNHGGAVPIDIAEPLVLKAGTDQEMKDSCDTLKEETKTVPVDLATSKPIPPRSKLVRDPRSFGYRRLLPFLNEMAKNDCSNGVDTSSLDDGSVDGNHGGAVPIDFAGPLVLKAGTDQEMKDCCDTLKEETKIVPVDLATSKPWLTQCTRSRIVHHSSSFSYKRMLPFLMDNEISSQQGDRIKFRRVSEEKQLTSDENDVLASGHHHLDTSKDSPEECNGAEDERIVEEKTTISDDFQSTVAEVSQEGSTVEVLKVAQEVLASDGATLSSHNGELASDSNNVLFGGQHQPTVSEDSPEENNVAEVERVTEENVPKSGESSVLDGNHLGHTVSEVSQEGGTAEMQKATQKPAVTSDGDEANRLTSDKGEFLVREQPQVCDTHELLKDNAELAELQQCQSSESGSSDSGLGNPTKTVMVDGGADQQGSLERQDSVSSLDGPPLDVGMVLRPSDPCDISTHLSADEMSGCVMHAASGLKKVGTLQQCGASWLKKQGPSLKKHFPFNGAPCLEKRGLSPKKFSPKKGILKRHTRGCKGICMCLDCSVFRLHADRAFEFSRKQMQEADDIIGNLLEEVGNLRSLNDKSSDQEIEEAWQRMSRVEEVARERRLQMLMELNSHCKIPGPKVKFSQYVEEKITTDSSPGRRR